MSSRARGEAKVLRRAAELLEGEARILFDSCTDGHGDWKGETSQDDYRLYNDMVTVATQLRSMAGRRT